MSKMCLGLCETSIMECFAIIGHRQKPLTKFFFLEFSFKQSLYKQSAIVSKRLKSICVWK